MARVTVEDCAEVVKNRFDLVLFAAERTKSILSGSPITIDKDNDKAHVISLRELAERKVNPSALEEAIIRRHQKKLVTDPAEINLARDRRHEVAEELNSFGTEDDTLELEGLEGVSLDEGIDIIDDEE